MQFERRMVMKLLAGVAVACSGGVTFGSRRALGAALALRRLAATDAVHLRTIMNTCVLGQGAFHGECSEWAVSWAVNFITRRPDTVVLTLDALPVAFCELAPIRPAPAPLPENATAEEQERFALREENRTTFRLSAAGVRSDLLAPAEAVQMFRRILYYGFRAAQAQGFLRGECFAPWEQHPRVPRKWTDYPGCELVEPPALNQRDGPDLYWLRWQLDPVITALAAEGAGAEALDVL